MLTARPASPDDAESIARIYNEGIDDRVGTFETRERTPEDVRAWFDGIHPIVIVEDSGAIVAFASTSSYRPRDCYAGIAEFSVYVDRARRGRGAGRAAMEALVARRARGGSVETGVTRVRRERRQPSPARRVGFREVGVYEKHARLDGVWRDVVIVERLIPENQPDTIAPR